MIALVMAIAVATVTPGKGKATVAVPRNACLSAPSSCLSRQVQESPFRLSADAVEGPNLKMEAYRVQSRPCGVVGNRCPKKGRKIWQMGQPLEETISRSFGLD